MASSQLKNSLSNYDYIEFHNSLGINYAAQITKITDWDSTF